MRNREVENKQVVIAFALQIFDFKCLRRSIRPLDADLAGRKRNLPHLLLGSCREEETRHRSAPSTFLILHSYFSLPTFSS